MTKLSQNGMIAATDLYYLLGGKESIKILDATYSVPGGRMSPQQAFMSRRIEGAQFFDIDVVADQNASLPHTIPSPDYFADCVSSMGISNSDHVVIYDQSGAYMASSRAWWMFRLFGHENVYVLDGGLLAWIEGGFKTFSGPAEAPAPGVFTSSFRKDLIVTKEDILNNIDKGTFKTIDARPHGRFTGQMPEPRPGMRAGHIPGSINIPFGALLGDDIRDLSFRSDKELEQIFHQASISQETKTAVSCGSGVTACTTALALFKIFGTDSAIYDGSWSEWGSADANTSIEVSA
jgi:thiosulfate/3-mercaptopyruvate sulfurtransferase